MPALYVVSTPIGNLEDVTLRALRVLREVALIASEDTRTTKRLLEAHGIRTPLVAYTDHNKRTQIPRLLSHLATADLALVSEAGTPAISDPGEDLVAAAAAAGVPVVPVPGASAVLSGLVASGLPTRRFLYLGFLPRTGGERRQLFTEVRSLPYTLVAYESPHRVAASLADAVAVLGERRVAVCREMSKRYEEIFRGTLIEAAAHVREPRGEYTLVIAGASPSEAVGDPEEAMIAVQRLTEGGLSVRDAVATAAELHNLSRRAVYEAWNRYESARD